MSQRTPDGKKLVNTTTVSCDASAVADAVHRSLENATTVEAMCAAKLEELGVKEDPSKAADPAGEERNFNAGALKRVVNKVVKEDKDAVALLVSLQATAKSALDKAAKAASSKKK